MHGSARRSNPALGWWLTAAVAVASIALLYWLSAPPPHDYEARSDSSAAERACAYEGARDAAEEAARAQDQARVSGSNTRRTQVEVGAAQRRADNAQKCEERARNRADLDAQWRAAYAAERSYLLGLRLRLLALVEIVLLVATVGAAFMAIVHQREIGRRELRAYVGINRKGFMNRDPSDKKFSFVFGMQNTGQTPARYVQYAARLRLLDDPLKDNESIFDRFPVEEDFEDTSKSRIPMYPSDGFDGQTDKLDITMEQFREAMIHGKPTLYGFGFVRYVDVFNEMHTTRFCGVWRASDPEMFAAGRPPRGNPTPDENIVVWSWHDNDFD